MSKETLLKYNSPAEDFNWALPVGNGRIGGMIFGDPAEEIIKLNEDSIWSGGPRHRVNPDAQEGLAEVRALLSARDIKAAEKVAFEKLQGVTPNSRHYMPLGELKINMELDGRARDYSRTLELSEAVSRVEFTVNDIKYTREVFVSAPDEVMVIHITCEKPAVMIIMTTTVPPGRICSCIPAVQEAVTVYSLLPQWGQGLWEAAFVLSAEDSVLRMLMRL